MIDDQEFSHAFGALLRRHITRLGLTYDQVAFAVWGESGNKGNVSAYVNGRKGRPNARTIAKFRDALNIPQREIDSIVGVDQTTIDALVAREVDNARKFGIKEGMLIALARRYAEGTPRDFDAALAGLERALQVARDEREKGLLPSNLSGAVDAIISKIDELNANGELAAGQSTLDAELAALDEQDELRRAARARLYEKGIAQSILTRDIENACRFIVAGIDLEPSNNASIRFEAIQSSVMEWYERGKSKGLNFDLEIAISLARIGLLHASDEGQLGISKGNLANALCALGERESGTDRLKEAVVTYRSAIQEWTRERAPIEWATAQMNLGRALQSLGNRENSIEQLEQAIMASNSALEVWLHEHMPVEWAKTMVNLGNALLFIGWRERGIERLEEAVETYRAAIFEMSFENEPREWATAQMNLGSALRSIGERENGTERLQEAAAAYRFALQGRTRERAPLEWASVQTNLGNTLVAIGEREVGVERLEEAVKFFRAALEEWTRERAPYQWAVTQASLGNALLNLGMRESGTGRLRDAVAAFRAALLERTREREPLGWATAQMNLGSALLNLGMRESGTGRIQEAAAAYRAALLERTRERVPLEWAVVQCNFARLELALLEKAKDRKDKSLIAHHRASASSYVDAALEVATSQSAPYINSKAMAIRRQIDNSDFER